MKSTCLSIRNFPSTWTKRILYETKFIAQGRVTAFEISFNTKATRQVNNHRFWKSVRNMMIMIHDITKGYFPSAFVSCSRLGIPSYGHVIEFIILLGIIWSASWFLLVGGMSCSYFLFVTRYIIIQHVFVIVQATHPIQNVAFH